MKQKKALLRQKLQTAQKGENGHSRKTGSDALATIKLNLSPRLAKTRDSGHFAQQNENQNLT